jgi:hypothetical protein
VEAEVDAAQVLTVIVLLVTAISACFDPIKGSMNGVPAAPAHGNLENYRGLKTVMLH